MQSAERAYLLRLGAAIRLMRRTLKGWSQADLAREIKRDRGAVSRWENGRTSPSAFDLTELWRVLEVPAEWLLEPTDSVTEQDRRLAELRATGAAEAQARLEAVPTPPSSDGTEPRLGTPPIRTRPR